MSQNLGRISNKRSFNGLGFVSDLTKIRGEGKLPLCPLDFAGPAQYSNRSEQGLIMTGQVDIGIQISLVCKIYHVHSCRIFADSTQIDPKAGKVYIHQKSKK